MPPKRRRNAGAFTAEPAPKKPASTSILESMLTSSLADSLPAPRPFVSTRRKPPTPKPGRAKRTRKYRFNSSQLFCTFPKCPTKKEAAMANILEMWSDILKFAVVCEEKHEDEDPHLHAVLKFNVPIDHDSPNFADFIAGQHGSYEPVKSMNRAIEYVQKDGNFITHGELPKKFTVKKERIGDSVLQAIRDGATMEVIRKEFPLYWMMHRKKLLDYYNAVRAEAELEKLPNFPGFKVPNPVADTYGHQVATWINKNFMSPRTHKQPQLWLCGPPNIGKTYIVSILERYFMIYSVAKMSKFYDGFDEEIHKAMVFDEYKAQKQITEMNQLLEGTNMTLEVKGAFIRKSSSRGNIPIIILSNFTPAEAYSNTNPQALAPLLARLLVVEVKEDDYRFNLELNDENPPVATPDEVPNEEIDLTNEESIPEYDLPTPDSDPDTYFDRIAPQTSLPYLNLDPPTIPHFTIPVLCSACDEVDCICYNTSN